MISENNFYVDNNFANTRLDRFLIKNADLSHSLICKLARQGCIFINNIKTKNISFRLNNGDTVHVLFDIKKQDKITLKKNKIDAKIIKEIKNRIVYETNDIVIIDKPYGLSTQGGNGIKYSLNDICNEIYKEAYIVHRLDKETSGLIIVAKNREYAVKITKMFRDGLVKKEYIAIVTGVPNTRKGIVSSYISKDIDSKNINKWKSSQEKNGNLAITEYDVIKYNAEKNISIIKFYPKTGRTHQIRLHTKDLGCAIIGDFRYFGDCTLSRNLHLLSYSISINGIIDDRVYSKIPNFFIDIYE